MKKERIGQCRLCLKTLKLSFEHIPPESTNNKTSVKKYTGDCVEKLLQGESIENERYEILQKGSGAYTLCVRCNSWTGAKYVKEYEKFINALAYVYLENKDKDYTNLTMKAQNINLLNVLKQISCMFLSINPICPAMENLRQFVCDEKNMKFPLNYEIYMFYNATSIRRTVGAIMGMNDNTTYSFSEIIHYPISFLLVENKANVKDVGMKISELFLQTNGECYLDIPILYPTEIPLDYNISKENNNGE